MIERQPHPCIVAKQSICRPKVKRWYIVVDLTRFECGVYQSLDHVYSALTGGVWGLKLDVRYNALFRAVRYGQSVIINSRFMVCKTEHIYHRVMKRDKERMSTMPVTTTTKALSFPSLPTILGNIQS